MRLTDAQPSGMTMDVHQEGQSMNRVEKITVSLPKEYLRTVRRALKRRGGTVSAYIANALAAYEKENELRALLDDLDRELGQPDAEAKRWASAALK